MAEKPLRRCRLGCGLILEGEGPVAEKPLRRCRLGCGLILDDTAPMGAEMVAGPKNIRKTRAHCPSPNCNWCQPCMRRRHFEIDARERDAAGEAGEIPPDQVT